MINRADLAPGFAIPPFVREGTYQHWNRYAGVNYEFADHHMDDEVGKHEGFAAAIGMAPLIHAYMHSMLRDWVGEDAGWVVTVDFQLRAPFLRGRTLIGHGVVKEVREEKGETRVTLDIWAEDNEGVRLVNGVGEVAFPS